MDKLFWFTGALIWSLIVIALVAVTLVCLYEMTGATIFWIRVLRAGRRAQIKTTMQDAILLWWSILTRQGRGTWTIKNTDEKVKYPRPWYNPEDDRVRLPA